MMALDGCLNSAMFAILSKCGEGYIFIEDIGTKHYRWSRNAVQKFGLADEYFEYEQMWQMLIHPDDFEDFQRTYQQLICGEQVQLSNDYRMKLHNGDYAWMHCDGWYIGSESGHQAIFTGVISDVVTDDATDAVTNLPGNYDFRRALADIVQREKMWVILIIGIDEFKGINDLYSYAFGDKVLGVFGRKMLDILPSGVSIYRLDGDGFGVLFPDWQKEEVLAYYATLQRRLQVPLTIEDIPISFTISGGISVYPDDGADDEMLYRNARMALRTAKAKGKNQLVIYSDEILAKEHFKIRILGSLRESVKLGFAGFSLKYQPLVHASSGELYGCEALLRWNHADFSQGVSPYEFVPVLEESGLILEVGKWVFMSAVRQCAHWAKLMPNFQMSINVSSSQFEHPEFKFFVVDMLREYGVSPTMITLELTESGKITDPKEMQHVFDFIRGQGIKIAFDDFGIGYASLSIFRVLSADELKIDRSFLERLSYDVTDQKIITQMVNLCHSMNMSVCVEGIESPEIEALVAQLGPELLQGYYYNQPMTAQEFTEFYFAAQKVPMNMPPSELAPEHQRSMVYAPFRPAQPMSMEEVVDNAHAGIFQVGMDHEFTFLTCNEGYRRMLGYTAKEMDEKFKNRALGFVHPDDMDYVNEEIRHQLSLGDTVTIEFRVIKADGTPIWILGTGNVVKSRYGGASLIVVIIEDDHLKKRNLEIEHAYDFYKDLLDNVPTGLNCARFDEGISDAAGERTLSSGFSVANRYQNAIQQWGDVLFEYDFGSGIISFSDNFKNIFGRECQTTAELELAYVHEADRQRVYEALKTAEIGEQPQPLEARMMIKNGKFRWYSIMFTIPERFGGVPVSAIGKISDIDAEKRERDSLLVQSQQDIMTGLLNKGTTEEAVRKQISEARAGERYALYIIDIDDFKKINDNLGHSNGDKVICEMAGRLKKLFRDTDIVGRAGGDEFLAFMPYVGDNGVISEITERIIAGLRKNIVIDNATYAISVSMGMACYPADGMNFYDLFRRADSALYRAKELGKNGYCFAAK